MRIYDIIQKKRDGGELNRQEMNFWVEKYVKGEIPDYQISALLMTIYFNGLTDEETGYLTEAMINSGETVDLSMIPGIKADKHSTGGVGDKTTLIVGPIVAAAGVAVVKMSGRGLGFTGGTIDKMEAIPGFRTDLSLEQILDNIKRINIAIIGQSKNLVPADKKLYALRDVTATIESLPLIASSVMSKKLAAGADVIVLDVKYGSGAFMKTKENAEKLAGLMVRLGNKLGKKVSAVISSMDSPLGNAVGNSLEIKEVIEVLKGKGPADLRELCLTLAGQILLLAEKASTLYEGKEIAAKILDDGSALDKFRQLVEAQQGNGDFIENPALLPEATYRLSLISPQSGYIQEMQTMAIGLAAMILGAGRNKKDDAIDPGVGLVFYKKTGDKVEKQDTICMIHANSEEKADEAMAILEKAIRIGPEKPEAEPLIYRMI